MESFEGECVMAPTKHIIKDNPVTTSLRILGGDEVDVLSTGVLSTTGTSIKSVGNGNKIQVSGSVISSNGTAIALLGNDTLTISGKVEGKMGAIHFGGIGVGEITNTGQITSSSGSAIEGFISLKIDNGTLGDKTALISGGDFGIEFNVGSGASNLDVNNHGTIKGATGIKGAASDDVIVNKGAIQGTAGVAISMEEGDDIYKGVGGVALGVIDMGSGDDVIFGGAGADVIDGGADHDKVFFTGKRSDYFVTKNADGFLIVADSRAAGDGKDVIVDVEEFLFSNESFDVARLLSSNPALPPVNPPNPGTPSTGLILYGTKHKDPLVGSAGNDKLYGLSGNDMLTGGAGQDTFVFNTALGKGTTKKNQNKKVNYDTITDFNAADDAIWLDNKVFKKLGKAGSEDALAKLNAKFFKIGKATDKNDYLILKKGVLYYDADGVGTKHKAVEIMKFANKAAISAEDFFVI
jgi:Ca2+-binding RTX toxin-like protein